MRQVHNINESYKGYHHRKYGIPNGLIQSGILIFLIGMIAFNVAREIGAVVILLGIILFIVGIKLRFSRRHKNLLP